MSVSRLVFMLHHQPAAVPSETLLSQNDAWLCENTCLLNVGEKAWLSKDSIYVHIVATSD